MACMQTGVNKVKHKRWRNFKSRVICMSVYSSYSIIHPEFVHLSSLASPAEKRAGDRSVAGWLGTSPHRLQVKRSSPYGKLSKQVVVT